MTPMLWCDGTALEAARLYASAFPDAETGIHGQPDAKALVVNLTLAGLKLHLLNGGPMFSPNSAISFFVQLTSREAVDAAWAILSEGGKTLMALDDYPWSPRYGWTADRYGFNWQIMLVDPPVSQTITPFLMFSDATRGRAEEAMALYTSLFAGSDIDRIDRFPDHNGMVRHGRFHLGQDRLMAMDSPIDHGIFPLPSIVATRPRSTGFGMRLQQMAAHRAAAAGSKTSSACPGRSCRRNSTNCSADRTRQPPPE